MSIDYINALRRSTILTMQSYSCLLLYISLERANSRAIVESINYNTYMR